MEEFTPEQQQMYDALDPVDQQQVDAAGDKGKITTLMVLYQSTLRRSGSPTSQSSTATTNQQPSTTIVFDPNNKGGGTPVDLTSTYFQEALGVTGGRRVSVTGQVVPETYTGFRGTTSPMQELRGEIRTPIYFEGDQDKIALFGKAELVSRTKQQLRRLQKSWVKQTEISHHGRPHLAICKQTHPHQKVCSTGFPTQTTSTKSLSKPHNGCLAEQWMTQPDNAS